MCEGYILKGQGWSRVESCDLNALLHEVCKRHSSKPIDKICAIAFPFMKCNYAWHLYQTLPIYDSNTPTSVVWENLISSLASTKMTLVEAVLPVLNDPEDEKDSEDDNDLEDENDLENENDSEDENASEDEHDSEYDQSKSLSLPYTATAQLLCLFPHPSKHYWFPSWSQVQQYPNVSVRDSDPRDSDPSQTTDDMDYSLRIMSGRIYRGCSLQLIKPPTSETKAIYCCTMDGKHAQLVATVPGIELHIDSKTQYVLVDISPDLSLWPENAGHTCRNNDEGHEHLPIWPKSVIIVCLECPSADMNYRLRRVTTLEWECRQPGKLGPGCWLPFEPSLVHMRSIVCKAKGRGFVASLEKRHDNTDEDPDTDQDLDMDQYSDTDTDQEPDMDQDLDMDQWSDMDTDEELDMDQDLDLNVFCDPVAVASLLSQKGWHKDWPEGWYLQWPTCQVYVI